jgi:acyl carrier protein
MINKKKLIEIIQTALNEDQIDINSSMNNVEAWDSLGHIAILTKLDIELSGKASSIESLGAADSVLKIINALTSSGFFSE